MRLAKMLGADTFNAIYSAMPEARATVATGHASIAKALCAGIEAATETTEHGVVYSSPVMLRYLLSAEPDEGFQIGDVIIVTMTATGVAHSLRIMARSVSDVVVRLTLEAVNR